METMKQNRKITPITRFAYGTGNLLGSGALAISGSWLLYFYTTFCNMPIAQATLIFSLATYLDLFPIVFIKQNWDANSAEDVSSL